MLTDTSVWVDHLRRGNRAMVRALDDGRVWCHPFVAGELACGHLRRRAEILALLATLPRAPMADHEEVLAFVDAHRIAGAGLGWVDVHLLASAHLGAVRLWTLDRALGAAAQRLGIGGEPAA